VPVDASVAHVRVDATDASGLAACLRDVQGVVNCVAGSADTIVRGANALFDASSRLQTAPRIVHFSSLAVYGEASGEVFESTPPVGQLSDYGAAKLATEQVAAAAPSTVILRPGIVYGPGSPQWTERIAQLLIHHRLGDLGRSGDGYCNAVHVDDTVEAVVRALRNPAAAGKTFNLSTFEPPTWNEYFIRFARALGAVPVSRITRRRLKAEARLLAPPLKILQIIAGKVAPRMVARLPEPLPPSLLRLFGQEIRMNVSAAEKVLGMRWRDLDIGLAASAAAYLQHSRALS
jgi:nucleoside-diphosphate-sugar epimerase